MGKADLDIETRRAMQLVAREEMKMRIYADILSDITICLSDITICDIEGLDKMEYIIELQDILNTLTKRAK